MKQFNAKAAIRLANRIADIDAYIAREKSYSSPNMIRIENELEVRKPLYLEYMDTLKPLADLISTAEGKSSARTLSAMSAIQMLSLAQKHLDSISTKKDAIGTKISVDYHQQKFAGAYKYTPESTQFDAVLKSSGWFIVKIYRAKCHDRQSGNGIRFKLTEATISNLAQKLSEI